MARILCVDGSVEFLGVLCDELSVAGHETLHAKDGKKALELILEVAPDLVLCDVSVPIMSGHELLKKVREDHPELTDMPFVFLSALADRDYVVLGKQLGADDFLTKPIDADLLLITIQSRLDQVERLRTAKQHQFAKLYRSVSGTSTYRHAAPPSNRRSIRFHQPLRPGSGGDKGRAVSLDVSMEGRLMELIGKSSGKTLIGQMQIVGLEDVKLQLGARWDDQFQQVKSLAENIIRKHITESDVYELWEDIGFLVYFSSLDERSAALRAKAIGREIRQKILGSESLVKEISESCIVDSQIHCIDITDAYLANVDDIVGIIASKIERSTKIVRRRERITIDRVVKESRIVPAPVISANGTCSTSAIAEFDGLTHDEIGSLYAARPGSEELMAEFDMLKLAKASEFLCEQDHGGQTKLVVNVSFSTLENRRHLERYESACASLPGPIVKQLLINLRRCPNDCASWRIMSSLNILRRYRLKAAVELSELSLGNIDPHALRTPILTCRYAMIDGSKDYISDSVTWLAGELKMRKAHLLVYRVPTIDDAQWLFENGVEFAACAPGHEPSDVLSAS